MQFLEGLFVRRCHFVAIELDEFVHLNGDEAMERDIRRHAIHRILVGEDGLEVLDGLFIVLASQEIEVIHVLIDEPADVFVFLELLVAELAYTLAGIEEGLVSILAVDERLQERNRLFLSEQSAEDL